jgi:hypothetical protein
MKKFQKIVTTLAIATGVLSGLALSSVSFTHSRFSVNAQSASSPNTISRPGKAFTWVNFSDTGRPRRRSGGASRGCEQVPGKPILTALVPEMSAGLTLSQSPTFWFYLPYTLTANQSAEFVLKDAQDKDVYKTKLSGTNISSGIINLRLPSTVSLKADSDYHWYFLVYCNPQNQNRFVYANGLIRRVERPDLEKQLKSVPQQERSRFYTAEGIWYDALSSLGDRLLASPQDDKLKQDWSRLLQSVGLENLASEPLSSCCSPKISSRQKQLTPSESVQSTQTE